MERPSFTEKALAGKTPSLDVQTPGKSAVASVQFNPRGLEEAMGRTGQSR